MPTPASPKAVPAPARLRPLLLLVLPLRVGCSRTAGGATKALQAAKVAAPTASFDMVGMA